MYEEQLGIKLSVITAGFIGGLISLSMSRNLTPFRAMATVFAGAAASGYLTPIAMYYTGLGASAEHALAFLLGVTGMNAIAGLFKFSESFAKAPMKTLRGIEKDKKNE